LLTSREEKRAGVAARKSHRQRNQLFRNRPQLDLLQKTVLEEILSAAGAARLDSACMERRVLIRARSLLGRHPYL